MPRKKATALARVLPMVIGACFLWSVVIALGPQWWFFDMFTHFRVQYVLAGFIILPVFLLLRKYVVAAVIALAIIVHTVSIWPYFQTSSVRAASEESQQLKILFANIYYKEAETDKITDLVAVNDPDVIIFAELQKKNFEILEPHLREQYPVYQHIDGYGAYDISYFSKHSPQTSTVHYFTQDNPSIALTYVLAGKEMQIVGIHPHSPISEQTTRDRNIHLAHAFQSVIDSKKPSVLIGDFNISQFSPFFQSLLKESGFSDTQQQFGLQPSWHAVYPPVFRIPIDQVVVTPEIQVYDRYLGQSTGSDHFPVVVTVGLE